MIWTNEEKSIILQVERQSQKEKARSQNRKADGRNDAKHGRQLKVNSKTKEAE